MEEMGMTDMQYKDFLRGLLTEWVTSKERPSTYLKELALRDMEEQKGKDKE